MTAPEDYPALRPISQAATIFEIRVEPMAPQEFGDGV
jgi:hypothetical protein